ncbi:unnamed protein product [Alopecurus aequalis]
MRKFQESVKALQVDIDHSNTKVSEFLRDYDGSVIQMRMAYSGVTDFLLQWTSRGTVANSSVYAENVTLPAWEREANIREFYGVIFPSLLQLPSGITALDDKKQRRLCVDKFRRRDADVSQVDLERELECGICLEVNTKIVLPNCTHSLCLMCFEHCRAPFAVPASRR